MLTSYTQEAVLKAIADAERATQRIHEAMRPSMNSIEQAFKNVQEAQKTMEPAIKAINDINFSLRFHEDQWKSMENTIRIVNEVQQKWISALYGLSSSQSTRPKLHLIRLGNGRVIFESDVKKFRKENSQHLLILKALITESDETGFISYDALENMLVKNGLEPSPTPQKARERILYAIRPIYRFLGIPKLYDGIEIIKIVEGKGLKIHNPLLSDID